MRGFIISITAAAYLYGASEPNAILNEVAKLRQKYEECRQGQSAVIGIDPKVYQRCAAQRSEGSKKIKAYQTRISNLEIQVKENNEMLTRLQTQNADMSRELTQKRGVVKSLEQTLTARDKKYRDAVALNEALNANANAVKVSKIERESLKNALAKAKTENERLTKEFNKLLASRPGGDANVKLQGMQTELAKAQATIIRLQKSAPQTIQEKIVYQDRPVVQEKIVTKVVESTEKLQALQKELAASQATIANLKSASGAKVVYKDRIVTQEKVVYKERPVVQEKVVYKERPVVQEKIVTKVVEPTEKIKALQKELANAQTTIANLKNTPVKVVVKEKIVPQEKIVYKDRIVTQEKVVYKERPVVQEKVVYKDRPVVQEKIVTKVDETTRRQIDLLSLELERQKSQNEKLKSELASLQNKRLTVQTPIAKAAVKQAPAVAAAKAVTAVKTAPAAPAPKVVAAVPKPLVAPVVTTTAKKGASAYRMATNAPIYTAPGGTQIDTWESRRSFTAGLPSGGWVHITGYFVNRVWQPTREDENLWVKESDVIRR